MIILENFRISQTYSCVAEAENVLKDSDKKRLDQCGSAIEQLLRIKSTHSNYGWDGNNAQPVTLPSFRNALMFLLTVPERFPCPVPGIGADGQITLEWRRRDGRLLSLAFDERNLMNFIAFLRDDEIVYGTRPIWLGYNKTLIELLNKVFEDKE